MLIDFIYTIYIQLSLEVVPMVKKKPRRWGWYLWLSKAIRKSDKKFSGYYKRKIILERVTKPAIKSALALPSGLPDLVVVSYEDDYVNESYVIKARIGNQGSAPSGESVVYCNAISLVEHPGVNEIRIQKMHKIIPLDPDRVTDVQFEFPLHELHANEVGQFELLVDPKGMVIESNEFNNILRWDWPY